MAVETRLYTADDVWELSHQGGDPKRLELMRGEIIEMTPTGGLHGIVAMRIGKILASYVEAQNLGYTVAAETGFILAQKPDTVRAPDVAFIARNRMPHPIPEQYFRFAPDLAVEVVSPNDKAKDIREKVLDFLKAGTRLIWIVYPDARTIDVYRPGQDVQVIGPDGSLDGVDVLPDFTLPVSQLFEDLDTK
jgi:Uma2 family endonuclease